MTFLDVNSLNEIEEVTIAPVGEYELIVADAKEHIKITDDGEEKSSLRVTFAFEEFPDYAPFTMYFARPDAEVMEERKYINAVRRLKRFFHMLGFEPTNDFEPIDLIGSTLTARVLIEKGLNEEEQNVLSIPRIR